MNERELARRVRGALDESAERLPDRIVRRLAAARAAALAQAEEHSEPERHEAHAQPARDAAPHGTHPAGTPRPRLAWRIAAVVAPIALVTGGLLGIAAWEKQQRAEDLAELNAALLVDDVPITAYADRGFGVFLRNVSWEDARE